MRPRQGLATAFHPSSPDGRRSLRRRYAANMPDLLAYLQDPDLVARFQRRCGLFLVEARHPSGAPITTETQSRGRLRGRWDHQDSNSNYEYKENGYDADSLQDCGGGPQYTVRNWPLHLLFLLSAGLGHEVFYITCLPCIHWSLDPFLCRRLVNVWTTVLRGLPSPFFDGSLYKDTNGTLERWILLAAFTGSFYLNVMFVLTLVMYVGQVMKDLLKLPRPPSPPVVKLETRVDAEYGLPSTHAMAATAISFTLLLSAPSRIQFQFEVGTLIAVTLSLLVCLSRLYTGMHSVLDVICGVVISALLMTLTYPHWDAFDHFQLTSSVSPWVAVILLLVLSYTYPQLDHYSTTRGDTTTILGSCAGCSVGYWVNEQLGQTFEPEGPLPVPLPTLTANTLALGTGRFLVGVVALVGTRQIVKTVSLEVLYRWHRVPRSDSGARRRKEIEVPYKFATYTAVGLVNSIFVNRVFILLGLL